MRGKFLAQGAMSGRVCIKAEFTPKHAEHPSRCPLPSLGGEAFQIRNAWTKVNRRCERLGHHGNVWQAFGPRAESATMHGSSPARPFGYHSGGNKCA